MRKKHPCNSTPQKSIHYLISYVDVFILQKFDPNDHLQAFLSIETIATLYNEIFLLKCSTSLQFYFLKFDFSFLYIYIHFFYDIHIHCSIMLNCSKLQRFLFFLTLQIQTTILTFSQFLRVQPAFQHSVMMDVLLTVTSIAFCL